MPTPLKPKACKHCAAATHTSLNCFSKPKTTIARTSTIKTPEKGSKQVKKVKPKSVSKLKGEADTWFSRFVRLRDAYDMNSEWWTDCVTCGVAKAVKEQQAGHFVSRGKLITRFHLKNVHAQCVGCNMFRQGEQYAHSKYIDARYGSGTADGLIVLSSQLVKMTRESYITIIYDCKKYVLDKNGSLTL